MTSYDPYSYGAVPLDASPAKRDPMPAAADAQAVATARRPDRPAAPSSASSGASSGAIKQDAAPSEQPAARSPRAAAGPAPSAPRDWSAALAPRRRRPALSGVAATLLTLAAGGAASTWLWLAQHNPVLAGIAGAATLVASSFAWLLLRR